MNYRRDLQDLHLSLIFLIIQIFQLTGACQKNLGPFCLLIVSFSLFVTQQVQNQRQYFLLLKHLFVQKRCKKKFGLLRKHSGPACCSASLAELASDVFEEGMLLFCNACIQYSLICLELLVRLRIQIFRKYRYFPLLVCNKSFKLRNTKPAEPDILLLPLHGISAVHLLSHFHNGIKVSPTNGLFVCFFKCISGKKDRELQCLTRLSCLSFFRKVRESWKVHS